MFCHCNLSSALRHCIALRKPANPPIMATVVRPNGLWRKPTLPSNSFSNRDEGRGQRRQRKGRIQAAHQQEPFRQATPPRPRQVFKGSNASLPARSVDWQDRDLRGYLWNLERENVPYLVPSKDANFGLRAILGSTTPGLLSTSRNTMRLSSDSSLIKSHTSMSRGMTLCPCLMRALLAPPSSNAPTKAQEQLHALVRKLCATASLPRLPGGEPADPRPVPPQPPPRPDDEHRLVPRAKRRGPRTSERALRYQGA